jgi:hypothetical protein
VPHSGILLKKIMNTTQNNSCLLNVTLFFAIITFLGAFGYGIASSMSDYAKLVIGVVAVTLSIVLPFTAIVIAILRRALPQTQTRVVDGQAANYRLAAPREVFLPRVSNMGQAVPYGYQPPANEFTVLKTSDATGQRIEIDERIFFRFLSCKTPSRAEWTGAKEGYTRAAAFCIEQGLATRLPNGGLQWCAEFVSEDTRLDWAQSITQ